MTIPTREFTDLSRAAIERCRRQTGLTIQLLDGDAEQTAALLTSIAIDMIRGAAIAMVGDNRADKEIATDLILASVAHALGKLKRANARDRSPG